MSIEIKLTGKYGIGKTVLMSKCDYDKMNCKKLCMLKAGYVMVWEDKKMQYLHRWIFNLEAGNRNEKHVDHISGDKLDCRRENLRIGTRSDNMCNIKKVTSINGKNCTSKYKGVSKSGKKWLVNIVKDKIVHKVGKFDSEIEAGLAYNRKVVELHKDYAVLNNISTNDIKKYILEGIKNDFPQTKDYCDKLISQLI